MDKLTVGFGRSIVCVALLGSLAACGGGGGDGESSAQPTASNTQPASVTSPTSTAPAPAPSPTPTTGNAAPQITGSPVTEVVVGQAYNFTPSATDADGDQLTFSIASKPAWASFNTATGKLSGTPTAGDVGSHEQITISVSDGKSAKALSQFAINVVQQANGNVTLAWQPPTENTDGTPLTNLNGYKIHYGTQSGNYTNTITLTNAGLASYVVENLAAGTYFFAITAVATNGAESDLSGEASKTI